MKEILFAGYRTDRKLFTQRLGIDGQATDEEILTKSWDRDSTKIVPFKMKDRNYILTHNSQGEVFIHQVLSNGYIANTENFIFYIGGNCSNLFVFEMNGESYIAGQVEGSKLANKKPKSFFVKRIKEYGN